MYDLSTAYFLANVNLSEFLPVGKFSILKSKSFYIKGIMFDINIVGESHLLNISDLEYQEILAHSYFLKDKSLATFNLAELRNDYKVTLNLSNSYADFNIAINVIDVLGRPFEQNEVYGISKIFDNGALSSVSVTEQENQIVIHTIHSYPEYKNSIKSTTIINLK